MKVTIDGITMEGTPEELREWLPPRPNLSKSTIGDITQMDVEPGMDGATWGPPGMKFIDCKDKIKG